MVPPISLDSTISNERSSGSGDNSLKVKVIKQGSSTIAAAVAGKSPDPSGSSPSNIFDANNSPNARPSIALTTSIGNQQRGGSIAGQSSQQRAKKDNSDDDSDDEV